MRVATLRPHPTDPNFTILAVAPDTNTIIGRFEPARLSTQHKGYLVHATDIEALGRFLRIHDIAVADERNKPATPTPTPFTRQPFACRKCYDCEYTQRECSREDCGGCGKCHGCGGRSLGNYVIDAAEQREINARGLAKVRPLLTGWPLRVGGESP